MQPKAASESSGFANYDEKWDAATIGLTLKNSGMGDGRKKLAEWQKCMATAKSGKDVKNVMRDQLAAYSAVEQEINKLQLKSEKGKQVQAKLGSSFKAMREILKTLVNADPETPDGVVKMREAKPKTQQAVTDIADGMKMWIQMMKDTGFKPDAEKEKRK